MGPTRPSHGERVGKRQEQSLLSIHPSSSAECYLRPMSPWDLNVEQASGAGLIRERRVALTLEHLRVLSAALPVHSWPQPTVRHPPPNSTVPGTELVDEATWHPAAHPAAPDTTNAAPMGPVLLLTAWPYCTPSPPAHVTCPVTFVGMQETSKLRPMTRHPMTRRSWHLCPQQ